MSRYEKDKITNAVYKIVNNSHSVEEVVKAVDNTALENDFDTNVENVVNNLKR